MAKPKFEYRVHALECVLENGFPRLGVTIECAEESLNEIGKTGWKLWSCIPTEKRVILIFEREKE